MNTIENSNSINEIEKDYNEIGQKLYTNSGQG